MIEFTKFDTKLKFRKKCASPLVGKTYVNRKYVVDFL